MEQQEYLIDTNTVIDYLGNKLPSLGMVFMNDIIDVVPNLSVITKIEVLSYYRYLKPAPAGNYIY